MTKIKYFFNYNYFREPYKIIREDARIINDKDLLQKRGSPDIEWRQQKLPKTILLSCLKHANTVWRQSAASESIQWIKC